MHTITKNTRQIPVTGIEPEHTATEPLFNEWLDSCDPAWVIHSIEIQSVDRIPSGRLLFIKIKVDVEHADGRMPGMIVIIRDFAVAALTVLTDTTGNKYALLVDQPRVPVGRIISESVAGLIDDGDSPKSVILRELEEEAHMVTRLGISENDVVPLADTPFYLSPGVLNEAIYPFLVEKEIDQETLESYQGLKRGLIDEHESITVKIVPLDRITEHCHCATTLAMLHLYDRHKAQLAQ